MRVLIFQDVEHNFLKWLFAYSSALEASSTVFSKELPWSQCSHLLALICLCAQVTILWNDSPVVQKANNVQRLQQCLQHSWKKIYVGRTIIRHLVLQGFYDTKHPCLLLWNILVVPYKADETMSAVVEPALISLVVHSVRSGSFLSCNKIDSLSQPYRGKLPPIKILDILVLLFLMPSLSVWLTSLCWVSLLSSFFFSCHALCSLTRFLS